MARTHMKGHPVIHVDAKMLSDDNIAAPPLRLAKTLGFPEGNYTFPPMLPLDPPEPIKKKRKKKGK